MALYGFYLVNVLGLIYSQDVNAGLFNLQVKLSLLVFPFFLASEGVMGIDKQKPLIYSFVGAIVLKGLVCVGYAIWKYMALGVFEFQYREFTINIHPTYVAMYIDLALLFIFYLFTGKGIVLMKWEKITLLLSALFLVFNLVLLQAKMGMFISAGLIVLLLGYYGALKGFKNPLILFGTSTLICMLSFYFYCIGEQSRIAGATRIIENKQISNASVESTQVRYYVSGNRACNF